MIFFDFINRCKMQKYIIHLLASENEDIITDVLEQTRAFFVDSEISIINIQTYEILASTMDSERMTELQKCLCSSKNVRIGGKYTKNLRNGISFADIYPLYKKETDIALIVEHYEDGRLPVGKVPMELLYLVGCAYELHRQKVICQDASSIDGLTGVKTRDAFLKDIEKVNRLNGECSLVMFNLGNTNILNCRNGHLLAEQTLVKMCRFLEHKFRTNIYRVGVYQLMFCIEEGLYEVYAKVQGIMDEMSDVKEATLSAVVTPLDEDIYKSMYICEKMSAKTGEDVVTVVRELHEYDISSDDVVRMHFPKGVNTLDDAFEDEDIVVVVKEVIVPESTDEDDDLQKYVDEGVSDCIFDVNDTL